jgi:hypothetical protein
MRKEIKPLSEVIKITILEHIGESGNWELYDIFRADKMKCWEAVAYYIKEMNLNEEQKIEKRVDETIFGNSWYATEDDVRAYYYEI